MILTIVRRNQRPAGRWCTVGQRADDCPRRPFPPPAPELEAFCRRLRIVSTRDMDGTVTVVFRSILTEGRERPVGSSELAAAARLNRVTVIHHLQRLERLGLVEHTERKYRLRASGLSEMVERMREEMMESFREAGEMAGALDRQFMLLRARAEDPALDEDALPHTPLLEPAQKARARKGSR